MVLSSSTHGAVTGHDHSEMTCLVAVAALAPIDVAAAALAAISVLTVRIKQVIVEVTLAGHE